MSGITATDSTCFTHTFLLDNPEQITSFFPKKKSLWDTLTAKAHCLAHYVNTGSWVSEPKLLSWAHQHPQAQISSHLFQGNPIQGKIARYEAHMAVPQRPALAGIKDIARFFFRFVFHSSAIGAVCPSSSYLAKEITSQIPKDANLPPRCLADVGAGDGVFSEKILKRMNPHDTLDLIEIDPALCQILRKKFAHIKQVRIIEGDFLTLQDEKRYDHIIAGLPYNSLKAETVAKIFKKFVAVGKPGCSLSYFEYRWLPHISIRIPTKGHREKLFKIMETKKQFWTACGVKQTHVNKNFTPATVFHHIIQEPKNTMVALSP